MRRLTLIGAVVAGVLLLIVVPAAGFAALDGDSQAATNETAPGERLAGVVGVQATEIETDLEQRSFNIRFAQAGSQSQQAETITEQVTRVEEQIADLEARKAELVGMRAAGEISQGKYRAKVAQIVTEIEALQQLSNQSVRAARQLPADLLQERGINVTAIQSLSTRADQLTGQEVSQIAREIAGSQPGWVDVGSNQTGPPGNVDLPGTPADPAVNESNGSGRGETPPGQGPPDDGDGPPGEDPPDDPPGEDPPDDPPGEDPPDDPPGEDPPDDPPGEDPPDDPPDDPPGGGPPEDTGGS